MSNKIEETRRGLHCARARAITTCHFQAACGAIVILRGRAVTDALTSMQEDRVRKNSWMWTTGQYLPEAAA